MRMRCLPILGAAAILAFSGCSDSPATEPTLTSTSSTTVADSTTTTVEETRSASAFTPLGQAECTPPSPFLPWPEDSQPGELAEIRATSSDIDVWGLLWQIPPLKVDEEIKMVWRVPGEGEFDIRASQGATEAELSFGPSLHMESNFERPGDEWGTAFIFPSSGCWQIEITRGTESAHVWVHVET
jgi:hypothetical protein